MEFDAAMVEAFKPITGQYLALFSALPEEVQAKQMAKLQ